MCPPPAGQWVNVTFLQCNGTTGVSVTIVPEEVEVIVRGRIFVATTDSPMMVKAHIRELLDRLLPGYVGTFEFAVTIQDILIQLLNAGRDGDENEPPNLYVRLSHPYLGTPSPSNSNVITTTTQRKRPRSDSPENIQPFFPIRVHRSLLWFAAALGILLAGFSEAEAIIPQKAFDTLAYIRKHRSPPPGFKGGAIFYNREGRLPRNLQYKEWDVNVFVPGVNRGSERIVTNDTYVHAWYSPDHYKTFHKM